MSTERLENTASLPVEVRQREERILTPLYHSFVIGISWAAVAMLFFLILSIAMAEASVLASDPLEVIFLASMAIGVVAFVWAYVKRDEWLRRTSQKYWSTPTSVVQAEGQVHPPDATIPAGISMSDNGVDEFLRVSDSLLIRLQIPLELGITNRNIMDLAFKISDGDLSWSRRSLKNVIPETAYTEFSDILVGRGVLKNAPNKSYALTHKGFLLFSNVVVTGVPPPTDTTQSGLAG